MKIKAALSVFMIMLIISGCGYRMAIKGRAAGFSLYPSEIINRSDEITANQIFVNEVKSYLASIDALKPKEKAAYTASFILTEVKSTSAVKLKSGQTATVSLAINITSEVKDREGNIVFSGNNSASETYSQTSSNSTSATNRIEAIRSAVKSAMENFRYDFDNR